MTRIYDALRQAEKDRQEQPSIEDFGELESPPSAGFRVESSIREQLHCVYQAIAPEKAEIGTVITFTSACPGEGVSTLCREFAKLASTELGDRVLLLDADYGNGHHSEHFGVPIRADFEAVTGGRLEVSEVLSTVIDERLDLGAIALNGVSTASITKRPRFSDTLEQLRQDFDFILIDAPPVTESSQSLAFASMAQGVVFVVAAESTRWQVANRVKEDIEKTGGNILGVVLNKKAHHIPEFIYKRL